MYEEQVLNVRSGSLIYKVRTKSSKQKGFNKNST